MSSLSHDLVYALRMLRKNPDYTAVAVLCIALGVGANSTIFCLADAILLRPLLVPDASEVLVVRGTSPDRPYQGVSHLDFTDLQAHCGSFQSLAAFSGVRLSFTPDPGAPATVRSGLMVSGNFFDALGLRPSAGRFFRGEEDQVPGRDAVAVLSRSFYASQFGADPSAIGRAIRLNAVDFTVIGVVPAGFTGMDQYSRADIYVPAAMAARLGAGAGRDVLEKRDNRGFTVCGRLKPGVTRAAARAELAAFSRNQESAWPVANRDYTLIERSVLQDRIDRSPPEADLVVLLLSLAAFVLAIACANVAGLLLSRARTRSREIALRMAIGAGRGRLVRQLLTEGLLVALAGGAAGLLLAGLGADAISSIQIPADPPVLLPVRLDLRVLLFTLAVSVVSSVLFGLAPALYTTRTDLAVALKQGEAAAAGRRRLPGRHLLVAGQVAVSLVLLHAAFSYLHQFHAALASGPGFRTDHLLMMSFDPSLSGGTADRAGRFYRDLEQQAGTSAGVHRAALASVVPLGLSSDVRGIVPEGFQLPAGRDRITVGAATVTTAYFEVAGIPIVAGRGFRDTDQEGAPRVAIVNQTTARRFWPDGAAVGCRIRLKGPAEDWVEVVGIARDSKYYWIGESPTRFLYLPHAQNPSPRMTLLVQTASGAEQMAAPLRELAHRLDPDMPAFDVRTMENFFDKRAVRIPSVIIGLVGSLGLLGLVLALAGLYGLVSYLVSRQTREIGIRMALGAASAGVLVRFLRRGLLLAGAGVAVGVALSAAVHPILRASFGLGPLNLPALVLLPLALLAVTALATLAPAWRASRIVPTRALRYE